VNDRPALVACDLDGTLFGDDGAPAPGVVEAVAELTAAAVRVVICTGRTAGATRAAAARLGLERGWAISYHGAVVVDLADGAWRQRLDLPRQAVGPVVAALHDVGATLTAYVDDERWVQGDPAPAALAGAAPAGGALPLGVRRHTDLAAALEGRPVTRIIAEAGAAGLGPGPHELLASALAALVARWPELAVSAAPGDRCEVHDARADKRTALAALCAWLGVPASAVVACGDGAVDAGMIGWAGLGVAVAEGHQAAAAVADRVVARGDLARFLTSLARAPAGRCGGDAATWRSPTRA
jgi:hydroxymethylpyrimidine pyrophosphatase-like HAD family hydrolase